jgi:hypothetical protein
MQPNAKPEVTEPEPTKPTPLDGVVDEVKTDAARDPRAYARETIVPEGGE